MDRISKLLPYRPGNLWPVIEARERAKERKREKEKEIKGMRKNVQQNYYPENTYNINEIFSYLFRSSFPILTTTGQLYLLLLPF